MNSKRLTALRPTLEESRIAIGLSATLLSLFLAYSTYMFFFWKLPPSMQLEPIKVPEFFRYPEDAIPFPETLDPARFPAGPTRDAYNFAKQNPGLLVQQPCYCALNHFHSLLHCFTTTEAATCANCISEALMVQRLDREGKSPSDIRAAIIREFTPDRVRDTRELTHP